MPGNRNFLVPRGPLIRLAGLLCLMAAPVPMAAQVPPDADSLPDGRRLRLGADSLAVYYVNGTDTVRTGAVHDALDTVRVGRSLALQRTYRTVDRFLGNRLDTLVTDFVTMAPIRVRSRTSRLLTFLDYELNGVTGWLGLANGDSVPVTASLPPGTFDASTFDVVLRASAIRAGWTAAIPSFLPTTRSVSVLTARAAGIDTIAGASCWRLEAEFAGMPVTFWVDRETRRLCQQAMQLRPGALILFAPFPPDAPPARST